MTVKAILYRLVDRVPRRFTRLVDARYLRFWESVGTIKTGVDLFSPGKVSSLPPLVYHMINFDLEGRRREIWVADHARSYAFAPGQHLRVYVDASGTSCWFRGVEYAVNTPWDELKEPWEDEDDEGDKAASAR